MQGFAFINSRLLLSAIFIITTLMACSSPISDADRAAARRAHTPAQAPVPVTAAIANMSYSGIYDDAVMLTDGRWEGAPFVKGGASRPAVGLVDGFMFSGDLDKDGVDELVVFLWENAGGSGTNVYLAAVGVRDGDNTHLGTALLGDRVQLRGGRIHNARVELDVVQQGPDDAACCPSQLARRSWVLEKDGLHEGSSEISGTLSISELAGKEWMLTNLEMDKALPAGAGATLKLDGNRITGNSACNNYFASVQAGAMPGDLTVSGTGSTRMACPPALMSFESSYLNALGNVIKYGFLNGRLALTWQQDGAVNSMLFVPAAD
jgi:heat shock protein HslJ